MPRQIASRDKRAYGWGLADQTLSSFTNFLLGILVARTVSPTDFGIFNVAFAIYIFALGVSRALSIDPLVIRYSTVTGTSWRRAAAAATGMAASIGIVFGLGCAIFGLVSGGRMTGPLVGLGLMMPGLLVQDSWRGAFFAARRGGLAFVSDLIWTVALLIGLGGYLGSGRSSTAGLVVIWGLSAMLAGALSAVIGRAFPHVLSAKPWWQEHRDLSTRFVGEFIVQVGTVQVTLFGIAAIAGLAAVGALRAALIVLGPVNILRIGLATVAVPEGARALATEGAAGLRRKSLAISAVLALASLAWGAIVLLLPDSVGTALLGENWAPARTVMIPLILISATAAASIGASTGLRAMAAAKRGFRARVFASVLDLCLSVGGSALGGAVGAAWGGAAASSAGLGAWSWQLRKALVELPHVKQRQG